MLFDTHDEIEKMKGAGFTQKQSETLVKSWGNLVKERFVTKEDLEKEMLKVDHRFDLIDKRFEMIELKFENQTRKITLVVGSIVLAGPEIRESIKSALQYLF